MIFNSFLKNSKSLLKSIDIYGSKIEINFQKQHTYKTALGGLFTIFILMMFGLGSWFFGKELFLRQNPTVIGSQRSVFQAKRIDVNDSNLIIMMGIADGSSQPFLDPSIFTVRAVQEQLILYQDSTTGKQQKKIIQHPKKIKNCSPSDIGIEELDSYFMKLNLPKLFCFENQELYMEGDFDSNAFAQIFLYVEKCKNTTSPVTCKSPEEIDERLRLTKIQYYLSDKIIDPLNFENPFQNKGINLYSQTSSHFPKELQIFFTNYYIESDIGLVTDSIETKQSFVFVEMKETSFFSDNNVLVRTLFRIQKQKETLVQRKYRKLADIIALVGGFLKILTTVGAIVSYPFSKFLLNKAIVDEIFNFQFFDTNQQPPKTPNSDEKEIEQESFATPTLKKGRMRTSVTNDICQNGNAVNQVSLKNAILKEAENSKSPTLRLQKSVSIKKKKNEQKFELTSPLGQNYINKRKSILEAAKGLFQITKNVIQYNFKHIFAHVYFKKFFSSNEKYKLVEQGINKLISHLDILFILNKVHEIDKLKSILLDKDQLNLFEFIPKPIISAENHNNPDFNEETAQHMNLNKSNGPINIKKLYTIFNNIKTDEEKAVDAYEGLTNIVDRQNRTRIDEALIELIDPSILYQILLKKEETVQRSQLNNNSFIEAAGQKSFFCQEEKAGETLINKESENSILKYYKGDKLLFKKLSSYSQIMQKQKNSQNSQTLVNVAHTQSKEINKTTQNNDDLQSKDSGDFDYHTSYLASYSEPSIKLENLSSIPQNVFKNNLVNKNKNSQFLSKQINP